MGNQLLTIPKIEAPVTLWVHPEGRVEGSVFLECCGEDGRPTQQPAEILNSPDPFLVVRCHASGDLRFYNKHALVRVGCENDDAAVALEDELTELQCRLFMMDGSILDGLIREVLPPERRRLYDYINTLGQQFLRLFTVTAAAAAGNDALEWPVCLVNKTYIVRIAQIRA